MDVVPGTKEPQCFERYCEKNAINTILSAKEPQ